MPTLVTGAGLIGASFAQDAIARGETIVFLDPEPRADFLRMKLGEQSYRLARQDVRDLPAIIETIKTHKIETIVHTAGLIGPLVQAALSQAFDLNPGGTRKVAQARRLTRGRRPRGLGPLGVSHPKAP